MSTDEKKNVRAARHERLPQVCDLVLDEAWPPAPDDEGPVRPDPAWETGHYVVD
jgi:hypothetical protein